MLLLQRLRLFLVLMAIGWSMAPADEQAIITAQASVYRIWLVAPLPIASSDLPPNVLTSLQNQGYLVFPIDGNPVVVFVDQGNYYLVVGHGSSYLISEHGHLVTNDHVLHPENHGKEIPAGAKLTSFVLLSLTPKLDLRPVQPIYTDAQKDLAILKADDLPGTPLLFADAAQVHVPQSVYAIGFPSASDDLAAGRGLGDPASFTQPKISTGSLKGDYQMAGNIHAWEHQAPIHSGNSGGPLVNACGQVVGTNTLGHTQAQSTFVAVALEELMPELNRLGLPFTQARTACRAEMALPLWLKGLSLGIVLLLLGSIAYLLRLRAQIKAGLHPRIDSVLLRRLVGLEPKPSADKQGFQWRRDEHGRLYRFDPIQGVIYQEDQARLDQVEAQTPRTAPVSAKQLTLVSPTGHPEIKLAANQTITLGRDPNQVDYCIEQAAISARHLSLDYNGHSLLVEDLGSTNGSYLDGVRLIAPTELRPGQLLSLGAASGLLDYHIKSDASLRLVPMTAGLPRIELPINQCVTIGRQSDNQIVLDHAGLSAHHCCLTAKENGRVLLQDYHSTNGTLVDQSDQRVDQVWLSPGQRLYLASRELAWEVQVG